MGRTHSEKTKKTTTKKAALKPPRAHLSKTSIDYLRDAADVRISGLNADIDAHFGEVLSALGKGAHRSVRLRHGRTIKLRDVKNAAADRGITVIGAMPATKKKKRAKDTEKKAA